MGPPSKSSSCFSKDAAQCFPLPGTSEWVLFTVARKVGNGDVPF